MSYIDVDSNPGPDPIPDKPDRPTSKTKKVMQKAKKNNLLACNELGILYLTGTGGLNQSKPKAFMWFETSAKLGCITAMSNAGRTALDVDDMIKAKYWLQKCLDTKWQDDKLTYHTNYHSTLAPMQSGNKYLALQQKHSRSCLRGCGGNIN